ncbi:MAG: tetratricopeptide repeat protein [Chloroflexota bacterium]|nr:tetratricopeptide repeat protein [Chloroflexota bacterium]
MSERKVGFYKFNPSLASPEVLQKTLVGRETELNDLLKKIEECGRGTSLRHFLIIGPRGIGKTHLLLLIYYALKRRLRTSNGYKDLNRLWIPIRFAEEEYGITTLAELLCRIVKELEQDEKAPELEGVQSLVKLKTSRLRGQAEVEELLDCLSQVKQQMGRRFLLLIDNFHETLGRFTEEDQGHLRDILMTKDLFLLVGAAPTVFEEVTSYERPFYNFFQNIWLDELGTEDGVKLIYKWWELEQKEEFLKHSKEYQSKIGALMHLTGGNPRLILSLYPILTEANIIEVEESFMTLLDELTPYFQARMKDFSPQQAKILDTMALMEGPASPSHIATKANLNIGIVTSQLNRLEKEGHVTVLKERGKKRVLYDIKERLFRLWRQMRVEAGRRYLSCLVTVIKVWYSEEELLEQVKKMSLELDSAIKERRNELVEMTLKSLWYLQQAAPARLYPSIFQQRINLLIDARDLKAIEREMQELLGKGGEDKNILATGYWLEALLHDANGEKEEVIKALKAYLELMPDDYRAWNNLGITLSDLERYEPAIEAYQRAIEIKPDAYDEAWSNLAGIYIELEHYQEAIGACHKAIEIKPDRYEAWGNLGDVYFKTERYQDSIDSYRRLVEIRPDIFEAWRDLAEASVFAGRNQEALEACNKGLEIKRNDPWLWSILGHTYIHLKDYEAALRAVTEAIRLSPSVPHFYNNRSSLFISIGKNVKALRDMEKAYELAQKAGDDDSVREAATRLVALGLVCSEDRISRGRLDLAEEYVKKGLYYATQLPSDKCQEPIISYLNALLKKKKTQFLKIVLGLPEWENLPDLSELIRFYRIAASFLETKDRKLLNQLFPELRDLIDGIV